MSNAAYCVICNEAARSGDASAIRAALTDSAEVWCTDRPGDATELALRARDRGFDTIVAAGGDGTLHEVINGLLPDAGDVVVGLLPLGTGNDFARSLGIPPDLEEALRILRRGATRRVDAIEVRVGDERRFALNMAVGGAVEQVNERLDPDRRGFWGPLAYVRATAEALPELEPFEVELRIDGERLRTSAQTVVVANGRQVAGGVPVAPRARIDDGLADVIVIVALEGPEIVTLGAKVLLGAHLDGEDDRVIHRTARRVELSSRPVMGFNLDGEPAQQAVSSFRVQEAALEMIAGPD